MASTTRGKRLLNRLTTFIRLLTYIVSNFRCGRPTAVDLELSNECNLRCKMCWFYGENGVGDQYQGHELTTSEVVSLIDQFSKYGPSVYIGGSEPFIRKDFMEILRHIKHENLPVAFTTNGTLVDSTKIETLVALGVDAVNFSIDGHEELADQIRGKGVFKKATWSIRELAECKKKLGRTKPTIRVNITITANIMSNLKETIKAIKAATDDGADYYRLHHLWYVTPNELSWHQSAAKHELGCMAPGAASHLIPGSQAINPTALAKEILVLENCPKVTMFPDMPYAEMVKYYSESPSSNKRCIAPFFGAVIKPNGDVKFCPDEWIDDFLLGNIRNDSFDAIWNNGKARMFRKVLWRRKYFPACKRCSWMYSF